MRKLNYTDLKIGTRVTNLEGASGVVIKEPRVGDMCCVQYDRPEKHRMTLKGYKLHGGNDYRGVKGLDGHCWWEIPEELFLERPKQMLNK